MTEVVLHIYDVTNSASAKTNNVITQLNKIMKDGIGLGGIFHSAIQIYDEEWSFGFCENGTGVFSCLPKQNPMYTYRESIVLGTTALSAYEVTQILTRLRREWLGCNYDLLSKNCNHFCDKFCEELHVSKLPAWVNRFANAGVAAADVAESSAVRLRKAKEHIISASKVAYCFLLGGSSKSSAEDQESVQGSRSVKGGSGVLQPSWFKNISFKSSGTSQDSSAGESVQDQKSKESNGFLRRGNSPAHSV